ncbi:hypothetical protein HBH56_023100 [Parastagonospora nodorum]|uniref:Major facilitator superfamily (MFS) profile domain-containing protein n=1 Tax=Phaeosphaeria nodorum (strain SN15 / ATCC MYA-4574 / FGSC 10173) TaxID=321614 RepID=A0A7U2F920_PHANO|nr:hypothetical protein HBH56_023100 [Parastagonospora nodorum]QRC98735.1 hypothetical protein JI435_436110 [Parastagonospora nodorum SN15]KAH3934191.1 hypothetical protein HBH54_058950 [Parastagonospora nodorum]KAH4006127.1 hypothetical protein HBI10_030000 [Parastagonospora nodorum]KAH4008149.1 hypothetical protein HBI13_240670 [Parastagonospora nodorum]
MAATFEKSDIEHIDEKEESVYASKPHQVVQIDNIQVLGLDPDDADFYINFSDEKRKRVIHKVWTRSQHGVQNDTDAHQVDIRLVPMLAILYLISHIDRANIGNAKIEGMVTDLRLDGVQWNIVLSVFFVPYILLEISSNMLLKRFKGPSYYLGILVVYWGIVMTMMGAVKNFVSLLATRILLGVFDVSFRLFMKGNANDP